MSAANKIAVKYWKEIKTLGKPEIFALCEDYSNRITVKKRRLPPTGSKTNESVRACRPGFIQAMD